jgi:hypothetical protein
METSDDPKNLNPGQGINVNPPEINEYLDLTGPVGKGTEALTSLMFQFPKWGFERWKIDEWIEVSPAFQQYYQLTIQQKQQIEQQIKSGLASATQAVSDMELVSHDFRKYREFNDFFTMIEKGSQMIKEGKKEAGQELKNRGEQTLKSIFIDQVDIHTGEGVALRSIASRWPTIIADFMQLSDNDIDYKKIAKDPKKNVSEAEGVILATKNKLYIEWRDRLFKQTVEDRYKTLLGLMQARKKSVNEYKDMLRPLMARYKMLNEALSDKEQRHNLRKFSVYRPESQAISVDFVKWWAWKPFSPAEKYKVTRQTPYDKIHVLQAGFLPEEIEILKKSKEDGGAELDDLKINALPVEPSIDSVFRYIADQVSKEYEVPINAADFLQARKMMYNRFQLSAGAESSYEPWIWSPYFFFVEMPVYRAVIRFPSGVELENIFFENLKGYAQTQNIVLGHYLELVARDKQVDLYLSQMLGEAGAKGETINQLLKENEWKTSEERKEEKNKTGEMKKKIGVVKGKVSSARVTMGKTLENIGVSSAFLRGEGPYELAFKDRFNKYFFPEVAVVYLTIANYMKAQFNVPGSRFL